VDGTRARRVLVLGADGYLGWPTSMAFAARGWDVIATDSYVKRRWEKAVGGGALADVPLLPARAAAWEELGGHPVTVVEGDLTDAPFVHDLIRAHQPDVVVHYGEQASAPYSMSDQDTATETQVGNLVGTLNLLFALREHAPEAHLVKLGTMGEYGTPNIDIEEGWLEVEHKGPAPVPEAAGLDLPPVEGARLAQHRVRLPGVGAARD
jgi:UDP-sulfoquinovose synthase